MTTLAEINKLLGDEIAADLRQIIADVKATVTSSYEGIISDKDAQIAAAAQQHDDALKALAETTKAESEAALAKAEADLQAARDAMQTQVDAALAEQKQKSDDATAAQKAESDLAFSALSDTKDAQIAALQSQLDTANADLARWTERAEQLAKEAVISVQKKLSIILNAAKDVLVKYPDVMAEMAPILGVAHKDTLEAQRELLQERIVAALETKKKAEDEGAALAAKLEELNSIPPPPAP